MYYFVRITIYTVDYQKIAELHFEKMQKNVCDTIIFNLYVYENYNIHIQLKYLIIF